MNDDSEPDYLFHYTSFASFLSIIRTGTVWATAMQFLSDSRELVYAAEVAADYARSILGSSGGRAAQFTLGPFEMDSRSIASTRIYQFSFSSEDDLLSQWRSYCPNGAGVSFGLRRSTLEDIGGRHGFRLVRCVYDEQQQQSLLAPLVEPEARHRFDVQAHMERGDPTGIDPYSTDGPWSNRLLRLAPQLKHPSFREEREWRLVSTPPEQLDVPIDFHATPTCLVPHVVLQIRDSSGVLPIERAVIGPSPHAQLSLSSVSEALRHFGARNLSVRLSKIPYRTM